MRYFCPHWLLLYLLTKLPVLLLIVLVIHLLWVGFKISWNKQIWGLSSLCSLYTSALCLHRCEVYVNGRLAVNVHEPLGVSVCVCVQVYEWFLTGVCLTGIKRSLPPSSQTSVLFTVVLSLGLHMSPLTISIHLLQRGRPPHSQSIHSAPAPVPPRGNLSLMRTRWGPPPGFRGEIAWLTPRCCWWTGALPGMNWDGCGGKKAANVSREQLFGFAGPRRPFPVTCVSS